MSTQTVRRLSRDGFAMLASALDSHDVTVLIDETDAIPPASRSRGGVRNLLQKSSVLRHYAEGALLDVAKAAAGPRARPTKLTLFDKTRDANWQIRWHQDLTITVQRRLEVSGFTAWSEKEGVVHVRAPAHVLSAIVALRVHLDDTPAANGALRVVPGSHRLGELTREQIVRARTEGNEIVCEVARGGAMLMSPLLLHASSKARSPGRRRVLHFEYSAAGLPGGLAWA